MSPRTLVSTFPDPRHLPIDVAAGVRVGYELQLGMECLPNFSMKD
jgi:hypothetical protein